MGEYTRHIIKELIRAEPSWKMDAIIMQILCTDLKVTLY